MFNWFLSFFSSESHLNLAIKQFESAARSAKTVKDKAIAESAVLEADTADARAELEAWYSDTRHNIDSRFAKAEKLTSALASFL